MQPLLQVNSLSKNFGYLRVLDDISFNLNHGEIIGLVGRRGAGKSTLLNLIGGLHLPYSGSIVLEGAPVRFLSPDQAHWRGIELVCQAPQIQDKMDVIGNIFLGREICWPPRFGIPAQAQMYRRARTLIEELDLPASLLRERPGTLNDEQRQLIAVARAFCHPAHLLLMDDILASLSYQHQLNVLERVKRMAQQGMGVIISSDNFNHLFNVTDRILVLYEGRLIADKLTAECTPREIVEMIVGTSNREQVTPTIWALESYHAAQRQTEELFRMQAALHKSLEASDSLNRQLVERLSDQVKALDRLNSALQETQRRLMTESEEERKALARELHDQVIQDLLSINYRLEELEDEDINDAQRAELNGIRSGIRQAVSDLRQFCRDLRPPTIDNHGLSSAIRSLAQEWSERLGVKIDAQIDPALGRLPEPIELSLFRMVQEGINNVGKHSGARTVQLTLQRTPLDSLLLRIVDDGHGVVNLPDLANLSASKHFGLVGISERAALLGGTMRIESPREGGLTLLVEIPSPYPSG